MHPCNEIGFLLSMLNVKVYHTTGFLLISGLLAATWKLSRFARVSLSGGAAAFVGMRRFNKAINSCLDHILDLDGSRMQRELANIMD
ncbi:hypothetical protein GH714_007687 [Hevea brasiliensis]|uniref:Uncharacterized protein n=1 Tax=Hevea brasiliensis TaxID=3981 RepID=A0A6A6LIX6_HEVBR|nr:hypothetical protein GH714_007687 [Hevea brasiliensis]